jgi:hypothetical protein
MNSSALPMRTRKGEHRMEIAGGVSMKQEHLSKLRLLSLCCLVPGLFGLILAASISTRYMDTLPKFPDPETRHMTPRFISGYVIYQTEDEDRRLDIIEYSSVGLFVVGLVTGLVYLRKWGLARAIEAEDDEFVAEEG